MSSSTGEGSNLYGMLWNAAERAGSRSAIEDGEQRASYSALLARAAGYGVALREHGVRPGDRVAVYLRRGADCAAAFFGVQSVGGIAVILNETLRPRQVEYVLNHADAAVLVTSQELMGRLHRPLETSAVILDSVLVGDVDAEPPETRADADPAQLIYTSGSTGMPKGVILTHRGLTSAITTVVGYQGLRSDDRIAGILPFSSVYGLNQLLCAVMTGATMVIDRSPLAKEILASLRRNEVTVLAAVPPLWLQLLAVEEFASEALPSLRILQNAGGHLAPDAVRRIRSAQPHARLFLQYGMTEVVRSTYLVPEEVDARAGSMGKAVPGAEVMVLREDLTPCGPNETGELVHAGPTVALGYWRDVERTAEVFRPHPGDPEAAAAGKRAVFSGDLVRVDEEGFLWFVGRRDRMIKTLGYRVGPDEILDVLLASGHVLEGAVLAEPDGVKGERIVAHVVLSVRGSLASLKSFCRQELPRHMQPARYEVHDALPRTVSGKHDHEALRQRSEEPSAVAD